MEDGICKRCKKERKSATEGSDFLCDGCFDFLNGVSPYDPAIRNPLLEAVQEALEDMRDNDDYEDFSDNEDDPEDEYYSPQW